MTDKQLIELFEMAFDRENDPPAVTVKANDYTYDGWLIMVGHKRSGQVRCVVEDDHGRLFVHNALQLRRR